MRKLFLLMFAALAAMSILAAPVDQATAMRVAKGYLANEAKTGQIMAPAALNPVLIKTEYSEGKIVKPVYYIFNTSTTFIVVAGDDRAEEILMVGDEPLDLVRPLPDAMQYMLDCYKEQITFLFDNPTVQVERLSDKYQSLRGTRATYGPYLTARWDQEAPYWNQCKFTRNGTTYQCLTGCPATSAAMVMYYWKFPTAEIPAMASYTSILEINQNTSYNFTYPSLPAVTFDWANMRDSYSSSASGTTANAVATLMRYIGQAEKMMYGTSAAGGSGIYHQNADIVASMFRNWGYKSTARLIKRSSAAYNTDEKWSAALITEMEAARPIVFMALDQNSAGHAFNVDGYRESDSKFHVNWGWGGYGNNWFALNAFTDYSGSIFNNSQQAIVGIEGPGGLVPTPELTVDATSLTFTGQVGETYTQTFTVSGVDLSDDVSVSIAGATTFTVSPTTITKAQATAGATVTVTYKPTAATTQSATITITSNGAQSRTITVKGTAAPNNTPSLIADPSSLSFTGEVGQTYTQTFYLKGYNLTSSVSLTASGAGFSIDKTILTKTAVNNGITLTVTYKPTTSGTHTGSIEIKSSGAQTIYVNLDGTATAAPVLTVNPTSLSFSTTVGQPVSKTFTVSGTDLIGIVALEVNGTGFTLNKNNISSDDAMAGTTITVTFNPTEGGNHTGTVTLSTPGAQPVTVSLNGSATSIPTLAANPTSLSFNTVVGTPVTETFNVTGTNLTGNVSVACNGAGFTVDKASITKADATAGATVTVTYDPTAAGNHTGTITLSSSGAQTVTVALTGTATEPVRTITATPTTLNFTTLVGQTVTNTFNVSGENLTGNLTLSLTDANGVYSITPTTLTASQAMAGNVPVTVTYAPTSFGVQSATVTISGGGAPAATVTLNGQADLIKYAPVMLPANEEYINLTQFRAEWTDATPEANVASYTLEVNPKDVAVPVELLGYLDGADYSGSYADLTLSAPWGGAGVRGGNGAIYTKNNYNGIATGTLTFTVPEGYNNATFTLKITTASGNYGAGNVTASTTQTPAIGHNFTGSETYSWLLTASSGEKISIYSTDASYSPDMVRIEVYSGNATASSLRANETETENGGRLITGITDKFYTVENLLAEGTFLYRVKALYLDGTESDWSNIEEVTLFQNGHGFELGDVNHDGVINITDVTVLINSLLSNSIICEICADVNEDGNVNITDVTVLINKLLSGGIQNASLARLAIEMGR